VQSQALTDFLILYTWFLLVALLAITFFIARFYQKFSGNRTYYRWFIAPALLFGVATVREASMGVAVYEPLAGLLAAVGGLLLTALALRLYWLMILRKPES
jgi:hypothetical protein